jgi:adenylate kinase
MGDLLRDHVSRRTDLGCAVQGHLDRGELVPDEIALGLLRQAYIAAKATGGEFVLDGWPRTMAQARSGYQLALELGMTANVALHLKADDQELTRRLLARAAIEHRSDDTEEVVRQRLDFYHRVTHPMLTWYRRRGILMCVDAMRPARHVGREILAALEVMRPMVDYIPEELRRPVDLTGLDDALDATLGQDTTPALTITPG